MPRLSHYTINWTVDALVHHVKNGDINFDIAVQRSYTWEPERKNLLILSILEDLHINIFLFSLRGDENTRHYNALDGKQRSNAIVTFIDGGYALGENSYVYDNRDMEIDLSGMKFSDLPQWAQNRILNYSVYIYCYDGLSEELEAKLFYRFNNGKPLRTIELTRVKAPSLEKFQQLAKHEVVDKAVTVNGKANFTHEELAMKAWAICFVLPNDESMSFEAKKFRPMIETADVDDGEIDEITNYFDIILRIHNSLDATDVKQRKIAKSIVKNSHLVGLTRLVMEAMLHNIEESILKEWVKVFFDAGRYATISEEYNAAGGSGTSKRNKIDTRVNAMVNHLTQFARQVEPEAD